MKTGLERLVQLYPHVSDDTPLPTKCNSKDKAPTLFLQQNNLVAAYKDKSFVFNIIRFKYFSFQDLRNYIKIQPVFVLIILFHH
jgi:hypothetical protein